MARCCREARVLQKISYQPAGSAITGCIFHRSGLGGVVQNRWVSGMSLSMVIDFDNLYTEALCRDCRETKMERTEENSPYNFRRGTRFPLKPSKNLCVIPGVLNVRRCA